ncbi:hypothetical protein TNCV_635751 [Trichonephila clavipes]|nr:hypothetical protein TNCV_635751 [Trichonephila clavipes]
MNLNKHSTLQISISHKHENFVGRQTKQATRWVFTDTKTLNLQLDKKDADHMFGIMTTKTISSSKNKADELLDWKHVIASIM